MRTARRGILTVLAVVLCCSCQRPDDSLVLAVALLPGELPAYRRLLDTFEAESGLEVRVVAQQYPEIRRALAVEAAGGHGTLDLVELDVYDLATVAGDVDVLDEGRLAAELGVLDEAAVAAGRIDGLRFLPHRLSWQALLYDHSVLAAAPATWPELLDVARRHPGKIGLKGSRSEGLTCDVLPFVWSAGGSGERFDDDGARAAFAFFAELAPYLHPDSSTFKEATIAEAMARGEIVLHLNWPFAMSLYASQGLAPQRMRSAPLPRSPSGGRATVLGGGYLAIPSGSRRQEDALVLLRFLLSHQAQQQLRDRLGWFSPRRDVEVAGGDGDLLAGFAAMRTEVKSRPQREDYPLLSRAWQRAFRAVAYEGAAPEAALAEARAALSPGKGLSPGAEP